MHIFSHFAYLDAGTGSLIIQSLIGIFAGIAVFFRRFFYAVPHKMRALFGRDKKAAAPKEDK